MDGKINHGKKFISFEAARAVVANREKLTELRAVVVGKATCNKPRWILEYKKRKWAAMHT